MKIIYIARDFTDTPGGREKGAFTGVMFRENLLIPALRDHSKVIVDLSDVIGFGSSFLEESFGGLIRAGFSLKDLKNKLVIQGGLPVESNRIWEYIQNEANRLGKIS
ncbi:STAS-like domain-containing protein [Craterilacuibacter sp. RT1T]|uniref:STAS-like domain-containing protein n=1 Tax=Craterilacuibacter sp. RT1T TaxID=2942211 RepID=UPI0020BDE543|nr:STAS-like domain-containing protein [Craterilacuibacter sp. RT1T]MCL6262758.1 STAS-like domain-containing protein [Craterilacuibacter sp. RT1T]